MFGRWTLVRRADVRDRDGWKFVCRCECDGKEVVVPSRLLRCCGSRSCGCVGVEKSRIRMTTHGDCANGKWTKEYRTWTFMIQRCTNENSPNYYLYGARGIKVCERWSKYTNFLEDMGRCPDPKWSIERKDSNGDYEPNNCVWASAKVQQASRRDVVKYAVGDVTKTLYDWADEKGLQRATVRDRWKRGDRGDRLFRPPDHIGPRGPRK